MFGSPNEITLVVLFRPLAILLLVFWPVSTILALSSNGSGNGSNHNNKHYTTAITRPSTSTFTETCNTIQIENGVAKELFEDSRSDVLNLLNHPLQIQLLTGDLPMGSFRRLVKDR